MKPTMPLMGGGPMPAPAGESLAEAPDAAWAETPGAITIPTESLPPGAAVGDTLRISALGEEGATVELVKAEAPQDDQAWAQDFTDGMTPTAEE